MINVLSYLLTGAYSGIFSSYGAAALTCRVNGQLVDCPKWFNGGSSFIIFSLLGLLYLAIFILMFASMWIIFKKAGKPGWAAIVPIYNTIIMLEIAKKPIWWILLMFIPFVNIIVSFIVTYNLSKTFGKGTGFAIGLIILPLIFYPIMAFGKSTYAQAV